MTQFQETSTLAETTLFLVLNTDCSGINWSKRQWKRVRRPSSVGIACFVSVFQVKWGPLGSCLNRCVRRKTEEALKKICIWICLMQHPLPGLHAHQKLHLGFLNKAWRKMKNEHATGTSIWRATNCNLVISKGRVSLDTATKCPDIAGKRRGLWFSSRSVILLPVLLDIKQKTCLKMPFHFPLHEIGIRRPCDFAGSVQCFMKPVCSVTALGGPRGPSSRPQEYKIHALCLAKFRRLESPKSQALEDPVFCILPEKPVFRPHCRKLDSLWQKEG